LVAVNRSLRDRVVDHGLGDHAALRQRDRDAVLREAVHEVGGAIDRVDDPGVFCLVVGVGGSAGFFAQEGVVRVGFGQHFDDGLFGGLVDVGDEVLVVFSVTITRSRSNEARLMTAAARRAAFTAVLIIGCMGFSV
jgi:hypothetical protein